MRSLDLDVNVAVNIVGRGAYGIVQNTLVTLPGTHQAYNVTPRVRARHGRRTELEAAVDSVSTGVRFVRALE